MEINVILKTVSCTSKVSKKAYVEQVLIFIDEYPAALLHIDTFHSPDKSQREIYDLLREGNDVKATMTLTVNEAQP